MSVTYYVALPFLPTEEGIAAGEALECPNEVAAIRRADAMSRRPPNVGALAFKSQHLSAPVQAGLVPSDYSANSWTRLATASCVWRGRVAPSGGQFEYWLGHPSPHSWQSRAGLAGWPRFHTFDLFSKSQSDCPAAEAGMKKTDVMQNKSDTFWEWVPALAFVAVLAGVFFMREEPIKFISNYADAPAITTPMVPSQNDRR